jgi:xanthine dehydrogenase YagT iron-sulfur-binding subunit
MEPDEKPLPPSSSDLTRREFVGTALITGAIAAATPLIEAQTTDSASTVTCALTINGQTHNLHLDPRVTVLDLLREHLHMTGTKKGCDHGQCGACTVLVNGRRINSCLALAVSHDGDKITTIEGLASGQTLHPMQTAFMDFDGFQCGYCTPGQICSAVALMQEVKEGVPSAVTPHLADVRTMTLSDDEIRERMAGNICRCGAYPNIVAAVRYVNQQQRRTG